MMRAMCAMSLLVPGLALAQTAPAAAPAMHPYPAPAAAAPAPAPAAAAPAPAAAAPAPAPAAAPAPESEDYADTRKGFDGRLMLGASLRTLSATRVYAGALQGSFGGQIRHVAVHGDIDFEHGRTSYGLATTRLRFGPSVEGVIDRLRIGGGFGLMYSSFRRATRSDSVGALGLDLTGLVLIDVVRFDGGAFVAGARADLEFLLGVQVGGSLQLGVRF